MSSSNCPNPDNTSFLPAATHFLLLCNCVRVIYRACAHADYPMAAFIVFTYSASLSLEHCLAAFAKLPRDEQSRRRDVLKVAIWFLYSAITFGFVVQLTPLFPTRAYGAWIYAIVIAFSSAMFYLYVVWDESTQSSGSEKGCGEKRKRYSECDFPFPMGKMMREKKIHCHEYDSVLEKVYQLDVKSAFLHGELQEEMHVDQPLGYVKQGSENKDCNPAYTPTERGIKLMGDDEAKRINATLYKQIVGSLMYMTSTRPDCNPACTPTECGRKLMRDDGAERKNATLYKQTVGSLMYMTSTRPDIIHGVSLISRYMENPSKNHMLAAKRIFHYLKGTTDFGVLYKTRAKENLIGFFDSDYAGDLEDRKSTSGFVFMMSSGVVS